MTAETIRCLAATVERFGRYFEENELLLAARELSGLADQLQAAGETRVTLEQLTQAKSLVLLLAPIAARYLNLADGDEEARAAVRQADAAMEKLQWR